MQHLLAVLLGVPVFWHLVVVAGTAYDAGRTGMGRRKWGVIALVVPLFGAFAYLLERSDRHTDEDIYDDGTYNVHESTGADSDRNEERSRGYPREGEDDRQW